MHVKSEMLVSQDLKGKITWPCDTDPWEPEYSKKKKKIYALEMDFSRTTP